MRTTDGIGGGDHPDMRVHRPVGHPPASAGVPARSGGAGPAPRLRRRVRRGLHARRAWPRFAGSWTWQTSWVPAAAPSPSRPRAATRPGRGPTTHPATSSSTSSSRSSTGSWPDLPLGVALDAACGTGRHAAYLAQLGHQVIGVDSSPEMLAVAREKLPDVEIHLADLNALPVADDGVDVVVCAFALTHVPRPRSGAGRVRAGPAARRTPCHLRLAGHHRRGRLPDAVNDRAGPLGLPPRVAAEGQRLPGGRPSVGLCRATLRGAGAPEP